MANIKTRRPSDVRTVLQSPGKRKITPKILLDGLWLEDIYGFKVGDKYTLTTAINGGITLMKIYE